MEGAQENTDQSREKLDAAAAKLDAATGKVSETTTGLPTLFETLGTAVGKLQTAFATGFGEISKKYDTLIDTQQTQIAALTTDALVRKAKMASLQTQIDTLAA